MEVEGPDSGWIATIGFGENGDPAVLQAREGWEAEAPRLLERLLQEPAQGGTVLGAMPRPFDEDLLYDLASLVRRRKPLVRDERLSAYVVGGSRWIEPGDDFEDPY